MNRLALMALAAIVAVPELASACPTCFQANSEANRVAFLVTTVLLTLLPLAAVGGLGAYIWRAARRRTLEAESANAQLPADVRPTPPSPA